MTVREIRNHLEEVYETEISPDTISKITDAVVDELTDWPCTPEGLCGGKVAMVR